MQGEPEVNEPAEEVEPANEDTSSPQAEAEKHEPKVLETAMVEPENQKVEFPLKRRPDDPGVRDENASSSKDRGFFS